MTKSAEELKKKIDILNNQKKELSKEYANAKRREKREAKKQAEYDNGKLILAYSKKHKDNEGRYLYDRLLEDAQRWQHDIEQTQQQDNAQTEQPQEQPAQEQNPFQ